MKLVSWHAILSPITRKSTHLLAVMFRNYIKIGLATDALIGTKLLLNRQVFHGHLKPSYPLYLSIFNVKICDPKLPQNRPS